MLVLAFAVDLGYSGDMANPSELSVEFIRQLKHELEDDIRLLEELPERISQKKRRYEAALMFAPAGFDPDGAPLPEVEEDAVDGAVAPEFVLIPADNVRESNAPSWTKAIQKVLDRSDGGLTHKELLFKVREEFPAMPVSTGEKGFYNGVSKLAYRKTLLKHGVQLYSSKVVDAIHARGDTLPEAPSVQTRSGSSGEIIMAILGTHAEGLSAQDLKLLVNNVPDAPASLKKHSQYIYNVLATLIGSGQVVKVGSMYRLPEKSKAPVGTGASF